MSFFFSRFDPVFQLCFYTFFWFGWFHLIPTSAEKDFTRGVYFNVLHSQRRLWETSKTAVIEIHPPSTALPEQGRGARGLLSKQRYPDLPQHQNFTQFCWGYPKVFLGQLRDKVPPTYSWSSLGNSTGRTCPRYFPMQPSRRDLKEIPPRWKLDATYLEAQVVYFYLVWFSLKCTNIKMFTFVTKIIFADIRSAG